MSQRELKLEIMVKIGYRMSFIILRMHIFFVGNFIVNYLYYVCLCVDFHFGTDMMGMFHDTHYMNTT